MGVVRLAVLLISVTSLAFGNQCCYHADCSHRDGCNPSTHWCSQSSANCEGSCHGHFCPDGPSPSPPPGPSPSPSPGLAHYCPNTAQDFKSDYGSLESNANLTGSLTWLKQGWRIQGGMRVSSKMSFDLRGGSVEFDMDLSNAHGGVNNNLYITYPSDPNNYCDSGFACRSCCAETDYTENNGGCFQATTFHNDPSGRDHGGDQKTGGLSGGVVHVKASYSSDGSTVNVQVGGNHASGNGLGSLLGQNGATIYSSQWVGWVPGHCSGDGNLGASIFSVSNLKIIGKVVHGPQPRKCLFASNITDPLIV